MFITNKDDYYFNVVGIELDLTKLDNCTVHNSLEEMYEYVGDALGLGLDEVEDGELRLYVIGNAPVVEHHGKQSSMNSKNFEDFINNFEI